MNDVVKWIWIEWNSAKQFFKQHLQIWIIWYYLIYSLKSAMNKNICDNFIVGINIIFNWMEKRWITKNEGYLSSETTRKANKNPYFKHHGITASWWFYWNSIWIMSMSSDWTAPYSMYNCTMYIECRNWWPQRNKNENKSWKWNNLIGVKLRNK